MEKNIQDVSLISPKFCYEKDSRFAPEGRRWQSAPSAAITPKGRIFCVYSTHMLIWSPQRPLKWKQRCFIMMRFVNHKRIMAVFHEDSSIVVEGKEFCGRAGTVEIFSVI